MIACYYFSWTTLSTVGFGDFKPYSNAERMFMSVIFLMGVTVFSFIIGELLEAFEKTKALDAENEDDDNLSKFGGLLMKFNNAKLLDRDFRTKLTEFFKYYWSNDKLSCFKSDDDMRYVDELPDSIKIDIFKNFLFRSFINTFRNFFEIPKNLN
jgi:hypothetical protein